MGNIMDSARMDRDQTEEITKEVLDELKELTEIVDHSLAGLAKSVDSMQAACEMLLSRYESNKGYSSDSCVEDETKSDKDLAMYLLRTINESVYDHKFIAIGTFMKLLKFIREKINKHVNKGFGDKLDSTVDKYGKNKELPNDNSITYCDSRIEELWEEIGHLKRISSSQKKQIQLISTKEEELSDENGTLSKTITTLENQVKTNEKEIYAIKKDKSEIVKESEEKDLQIWNLNKQIETMKNFIEKEKENERLCLEEKEKKITEKDDCLVELRLKLEKNKESLDEREQEFQHKIKELESKTEQLTDDKHTLQEQVMSINRKKIMHVQMITSVSTRYRNEMIRLLKSKIETPDLKLEITSSGKVKPGIPVLCTINSYDRIKPLQSKIEEETRGIKDTSKAAVIIVHFIFSDNDLDSITSSAVTLKEGSTKFRLFYLAFENARHCFSQCELNDRNIEEIVKFIQNEGVELPRWKVFLASVNDAESEKP